MGGCWLVVGRVRYPFSLTFYIPQIVPGDLCKNEFAEYEYGVHRSREGR
jgi:hypothetical protein